MFLGACSFTTGWSCPADPLLTGNLNGTNVGGIVSPAQAQGMCGPLEVGILPPADRTIAFANLTGEHGACGGIQYFLWVAPMILRAPSTHAVCPGAPHRPPPS